MGAATACWHSGPEQGPREESTRVPWGSGKTLGLSAEHQLSQLPLWWPGNAPQNSQGGSPRCVNANLYGKKDFVEVAKDLELERWPGISGMALM